MFFFFFFNDTATTEIYTLSLHDALPISVLGGGRVSTPITIPPFVAKARGSSRSEEHTSELHHDQISYAVFCLKKKKKSILTLIGDKNNSSSPRTGTQTLKQREHG